MKVIHGLESVELPLTGSVLTIGNFDGVHRGHQQLLAQGGMLAEMTGNPLTVLTFEPHPLSIVAPDRTPPPLMNLNEKLSQLAAAGVELTIIADSRSGLLSMEAENFIEQVMVDHFHPSHVVEGPSFGFGRGRRGTLDMLSSEGKRHDYEVCIVAPIEMPLADGSIVMVSSSVIRDMIREGHTHAAHLCLGRPHSLSGPVVHGHKRGRNLGFPTVNIDPQGVLIPADGVYSGFATIAGNSFPAAISIGTTPTFEEQERKIEAFLLDFNQDVYGQTIQFHFLKYIRAQMKFSGEEELARHMKEDVEEVRRHAHDYEVSTRS